MLLIAASAGAVRSIMRLMCENSCLNAASTNQWAEQCSSLTNPASAMNNAAVHRPAISAPARYRSWIHGMHAAL